MRFEGAKMVKNGQTYYLITDQVGSIRAVCDASGNIVKEITYDSFGNILDDTAPAFTIPLGFAGGLHDRDTNLVRFGFRDYDPDTGRWTVKDPILCASGDIDFYSYCLTNPISLVDSDGLNVAVDALRWFGDPSILATAREVVRVVAVGVAAGVTVAGTVLTAPVSGPVIAVSCAAAVAVGAGAGMLMSDNPERDVARENKKKLREQEVRNGPKGPKFREEPKGGPVDPNDPRAPGDPKYDPTKKHPWQRWRDKEYYGPVRLKPPA